MTWLVAIDESGNLGPVSRFFVMSAIITKRVRVLNPVFKSIPKFRKESKFSNSTDEEIEKVLHKLSMTDTYIISVVVDKHDYSSPFYGIDGKSLYCNVLSKLLNDVFNFIGHHDVSVYIDRSTFIGLNELRVMAMGLTQKHGCNLIRCEKVTSHQNKCIQIADFVAGSFFVSSQYGIVKFTSIIQEKVILCP